MSAEIVFRAGTRPLFDFQRRRIEPDEIHLYWLCIDNETCKVRAINALLDHEEQVKVGQYLREQDRDRQVASRAALRLILGAYLGNCPRSLQFVVSGKGKPVLENGHVSFNVSHSGARVVIAVTRRGRELGVDVERIRPMPDLEGLARHVTTAREWALWRSMAPELKNPAFYELWTRKEAVLKLDGSGLSRNPDSLEVGFSNGSAPTGFGSRAGLVSFTPESTYACALAFTDPECLRAISLEKVSFRQWVETAS
jgi:4'-phosphopantetheinyl transferase